MNVSSSKKYQNLTFNNNSNHSDFVKIEYDGLRDHSSITSSKKWVVGWVQKMAIFDDLQFCKSSKRWAGGPRKVKNLMT